MSVTSPVDRSPAGEPDQPERRHRASGVGRHQPEVLVAAAAAPGVRQPPQQPDHAARAAGARTEGTVAAAEDPGPAAGAASRCLLLCYRSMSLDTCKLRAVHTMCSYSSQM